MRRRTTRIAAFLVATMLLFSGCVAEGSDTTQTTTQTTTAVTTTAPTTAVTTTAATTVPTTLESAATTTATVTTTMVTTTKTTTKATTTAAPTTTAPTRPPYALHKDHLSGWEVTVDGKQVTVSVIEDETGWTYVSLVPLLDSLEGVDRIVWEDDSHATIYRTPISDSPTAQGTIFSLDILTCALIQISPPTPTSLPAHTSDSNLLFMDLIGGGGTGAGYGVGPIRGCLVRDNEVFVDQYALMKVAWHFDFEFDYLWEQKRMEITLHKDHLIGWEVTVDGKQVTVSVIEDETGWTYVSLVPLLDSLENVDRIVWENRAQAMIYRTPVSDSGFCAGKKFSLDIQRGELYQLIPLRDNWNILQIRVAGTTSHNVNGYIVRGNELFVDTHVLQMVGMSFDFKHEFLWEEQRLEITTPR